MTMLGGRELEARRVERCIAVHEVERFTASIGREHRMIAFVIDG